MINLQQISLALKLATHRSLLIIDEFGKGTDLNGQRGLRHWILLTDFLTDGAGLACGIFEYLLNLGDERPKVLAATHFHEIFENGFLRPRPHLGFGHMEIRVDENAHEAGDQITYLYKFVIPLPVKALNEKTNDLTAFYRAVAMKALELCTCPYCLRKQLSTDKRCFPAAPP